MTSVVMKQATADAFESDPLPRWVGDLCPKYRFPEECLVPRLMLRCDRRIDAYLAAAIRRCVRGLTVVSPPEHRVFLYAVPSINICHGDNDSVLGFFVFPDESTAKIGEVSLVIATGFAALLRSNGRSEAVLHALHILGHEYAHYEQWRDGRPCVERGVEKRGRELVRLALEETQ